GNISPAGVSTYLQRQTVLYIIKPEPGNYIQDVQVDGVSVGAVGSYTFDPLYADHTILATFTNAPPQFTLHASAGMGGVISPAGLINVPQGGAQTFSITPNPGCLLALTVDGKPVGARGSFGFVDVRANHNIAASFFCTIKASAGAGGKISPSGTLLVPAGTNQTFTLTPNPYYQVYNVQLDGVPQGPLASLTLSNIAASHTIGAGFALLPPTLSVLATGSGAFEITWPDIYSGTLLTSPVPGAGASWQPVNGAVEHVGGFYSFTVTPTNGSEFYGLGQ
ncbi:MAG: hypothetical protein ACTHKU_04500, partial [Verrucomicrobiota bacterium]